MNVDEKNKGDTDWNAQTEHDGNVRLFFGPPYNIPNIESNIQDSVNS